MNADELRELINAIKHADPEQRHAAALRLGCFEQHEFDDAAPLLDALSHPDADITFWALCALAHARVEEAIDAVLERCVLHSATKVRGLAMYMLSMVCPNDSRVKKAVIHSLRDSSSIVRRSAMQAGLNIGNWSRSEINEILALTLDDCIERTLLVRALQEVSDQEPGLAPGH